MTFWDTPTWYEYERLCGDEPGTRARLLASADWMTRVVDLSLSEAELWQGVRKSYKSIIRRAQSECVLGLSTSTALLDRARPLHDREAGRETRHLATWQLQAQWVQSGFGEFYEGGQTRPNGTFDLLAYVYFTVYGAHAYYFSAAGCRPNVNHALIWTALLDLKVRGVRWCEMGWQGEAHDVKGKNIEYFRRGFGGFDIPAKEAPALCGR